MYGGCFVFVFKNRIHRHEWICSEAPDQSKNNSNKSFEKKNEKDSEQTLTTRLHNLIK